MSISEFERHAVGEQGELERGIEKNIVMFMLCLNDTRSMVLRCFRCCLECLMIGCEEGRSMPVCLRMCCIFFPPEVVGL